MKIQKDESFLMIKIKTPEGINFLSEHTFIIDRCGYVWFCRFGKTNTLLNKISMFGKYIFLKDTASNGNKIYLAEFCDITLNEPFAEYPTYYNQIDLGKAIWFKLTSVRELPLKVVLKNFVTKSSKANLNGAFKSMCSSFYIQSNENFEI